MQTVGGDSFLVDSLLLLRECLVWAWSTNIAERSTPGRRRASTCSAMPHRLPMYCAWWDVYSRKFRAPISDNVTAHHSIMTRLRRWRRAQPWWPCADIYTSMTTALDCHKLKPLWYNIQCLWNRAWAVSSSGQRINSGSLYIHNTSRQLVNLLKAYS